MSFDFETEEYTEEAGDVVCGWDGNIGKWFVAVMDGDGGGDPITDHATYREAMAHILNNYPHAECYHEQNGGGVVGVFEPWEEFRSGWSDEEDDDISNYQVPSRI